MKKQILYENFIIPCIIGIFILSPFFVHSFFGQKINTQKETSVLEMATTTVAVTNIAKTIDPMKEVIAKAKKYTKQGTIRTVTSYTSTPNQTDPTPCEGANGNVCKLWEKGYNICATNAFAFGTILHVDKLGDCIVKDRMNKRFPNRIDWYLGYDEECLDGVDVGDNCPNWKRALTINQNLLVTPIGHINM